MERTSTNANQSAWLAVLSLGMIASISVQPAAAQTPNPAGGHRSSRQILVSVPDRMLAVIEDGTVIRTFPVSVGASVSPSPSGEFQIVRRVANPTYYHPGVIVPAGSNNPLGPRWIGLNQKGYGIHGTNHPDSIGHAASHGCIRLRNRDIKQLFEMVSVGDVVAIRSERDQQTAEIFGAAIDSTTIMADARDISADPDQGQ